LFWWNTQDKPLDKRGTTVTKDTTQAVDSNENPLHDVREGDIDKPKALRKRGTTVTKYVTRTVFSNPTATVIKTKTPGTTILKTKTVYQTKIKTRMISMSGGAVTTSDSEAVLENGGWMVQGGRWSGSVLAGVVVAVVMVVYA